MGIVQYNFVSENFFPLTISGQYMVQGGWVGVWVYGCMDVSDSQYVDVYVYGCVFVLNAARKISSHFLPEFLYIFSNK